MGFQSSNYSPSTSYHDLETLLPNEPVISSETLRPRPEFFQVHPFGLTKPWFQRGNEARDTNPPVGADILGLQMPRPR